MVDLIEPKRKVKTRKPHVCFACLNKFDKGTKMFSQVCKADGEIYRIYNCVHCDTIMKQFKDYVFDPVRYCYPEGCVRDALSNIFSINGLNKLRDTGVVSSPPTSKEVLHVLENEDHYIEKTWGTEDG